MPGIDAAGVAAALPLTGFNDRDFDVIADQGSGRPVTVHDQIVSAATLRALRIPLLAGRPFTAADQAAAPRVAILSRSLARALWPEAQPLGRRLSFDYGPTEPRRWMTVVGIAGDVRHEALAAAPTPVLYRPLGQDAMETLSVVVRSALSPSQLAPRLKAAVWRHDPQLALADLAPLQRVIDDQTRDLSFLALLLNAVTAITLAVTALGVVSLSSFLATRRRGELAIRTALGARPAHLRRLLLLPTLTPLLLGVACGVLVALGARRLLAHLLFGVAASDPATIAVASAAILALGALAAYLPARAAWRRSPIRDLRLETR